MLKLFGGAADHPLRDPREARRILEALPADEVKALEELAHWQESVSVAEGFKPAERVSLVLAIDEAAQPRLRKVARDYCGTARPSRYQENRMWTPLHEYSRQAGLAFGRTLDAAAQAPKALDPKALALAATRALRAAAQQLKWQHMRYGPVDPAAWGLLNRVYAYCEARGLAEEAPRQEFLKALMFSAASPDSLLAAEADLAERVIAELAPSFLLAADTLRPDAAQPSLHKRLLPCLPFCSFLSPRSLTRSVSLEQFWLRPVSKTGCAIILLLWFSN